jgi:L-fuconolactonase
MTRRIDAHQHFWRVERGDYHWMPPAGADAGPLRDDYLPSDLRPLNEAAGIDGTIAVQAAQTVAETDWLLQLAEDADASILGVVGWAPLDDPADTTIERIADHPRGVGVRPMLHDIPQDDWIARRVPREQLERVAAAGLVFEVLSFPLHLPHALRALEPVDELVVVIDHLSKPAYRDELRAWADHMRAFAARPRTYCKLSGMVTEVGAGWTADDVRPHADLVLEAFGPERVLFGTDWPVCLLAASHAQVVELAEQLTADLDAHERAAVFGGNAAAVYGV